MPAKEFMEAGKERLTRDTVRDATRQEIEHLNSASRLLRKKRPPIVAVFWFGL
jgi:demethoxyubiquinone hydroxylase (CLK1/Coq7/Cat5 family)